MTHTPETLQTAYDRHSVQNRREIERSGQCGCFSCFAVFPAAKVWDWVGSETPDEQMGMCPYCWMDTVLGDASGFAVTEQSFLRELNAKIFEGPVYWDQVADPHPITVGCSWEYDVEGNGTGRPIYAETEE